MIVEKQEPLPVMPGSMPGVLSHWAWGTPPTRQGHGCPARPILSPLGAAAMTQDTPGGSVLGLPLSSDALLPSPVGRCPSCGSCPARSPLPSASEAWAPALCGLCLTLWVLLF